MSEKNAGKRWSENEEKCKSWQRKIIESLFGFRTKYGTHFKINRQTDSMKKEGNKKKNR
jgi:phage terminase large subunit-like protein